MDNKELLSISRDIWGEERLSAQEICLRMGVVYGDICRFTRDNDDTELHRELGNMILSTTRWINDLQFDFEACIDVAIRCQRDFVNLRKNK